MNWVAIAGSVLTLIGVIYVAWRTGKSSDRALAAAERTRREEQAQSVSSAESSGFTRAKEMIESAAEAQRASFDATLKSMNDRMAGMQDQLDRQDKKITEQAQQIEMQHKQIGELQDARSADRRYIQKLLDLLQQHNIVYPARPDDGS